MQVDTNQIATIVRKVLESMAQNGGATNEQAGIFRTVDEAVEAAWLAQKRLMALNLEKRNELIGAMREAAVANARLLAEMAVRETGMGRTDDKTAKNLLAARKTPGTEDLRTGAYSGDHGLTITEQAPFGVIAAITPVTNPIATVINNGIGMVAAGNAVVFCPHPSARSSCNKAVEILHRAIVEAGGPPHVLTTLAEPSIEKAGELMRHRRVNLIVATGGPGVVRAALGSGKKAIGAGAGNPPAVVDETADIPKAARDIVAGAGFDNNLPCIAEKVLIAVAGVADALLEQLRRHGALVVPSHWVEKLTSTVFTEVTEDTTSSGGAGHNPRRRWVLNKQWVGKDARVILEASGYSIPGDVRLAVVEVGRDHPLVQEEQLMPILPLVRAKNVDEAIELAVEVEHGYRHTAVMHSKHVDHMTRLARAIQTTLFVKNAPSYAGIGLGGEGFTSFTIAGPTGEGLTSARCFTRQRRCTLVDALSIV